MFKRFFEFRDYIQDIPQLKGTALKHILGHNLFNSILSFSRDVVMEDEARRVSCVDIRNNVEDDSPAFQGRTASVSSQLDQWKKVSEDSDLLVRKLRDL